MKIFTVIGVAVVLCFSSYSFIAVGRAFAAQKDTHLCSWGETDDAAFRENAKSRGYASSGDRLANFII